MQPKSRKHRDRIGRAILPLALSLVVVAGAAATVASPIVLQQLEAVPDLNWQSLSNIGQTYGAASAVLSALALIGVAWSLYLQARESRALRKDSERNHHFQILQLAIENPVLLKSAGFPEAEKLGYDPRVHLYLNLLLSYWEMLYEVGEMPEKALREYSRFDLFGTDIGLTFWERTREHRLAVAKNRKGIEFTRIVDETWRVARSSGRPSSSLALAQAHTARHQAGLGRSVIFGAGLAVGVGLAWSAIRRASG